MRKRGGAYRGHVNAALVAVFTWTRLDGLGVVANAMTVTGLHF